MNAGSLNRSLTNVNVTVSFLQIEIDLSRLQAQIAQTDQIVVFGFFKFITSCSNIRDTLGINQLPIKIQVGGCAKRLRGAPPLTVLIQFQRGIFSLLFLVFGVFGLC